MKSKAKVLKKLHRALTRIIGEDESEFDFENQRHGFIVTCLVDDGDEMAVMHYRVDPENPEAEDTSIEDLDMMGIQLVMAHKAMPDIFNAIITRVQAVAPIKEFLDFMSSKKKSR